MRRFWKLFTSLRTAAILMIAEAVLLLLLVILPQRKIVGEEAFAEIVARGGVGAWLLADLGLGDMATSPVFLVVLGVLFLVMACVLIDRTRVTLRRMRPVAPSAATLLRRASRDGTPVATARPGWKDRARAVLAGFGYTVVTTDDEFVWSVKHRAAILGFPLFHASFFLLLVGGILIFLTRGVIVFRVGEGQLFSTAASRVLRQPLWGTLAVPNLGLETVDVAVEEGDVTHLGATLSGPGGPHQLWVNHPARLGTTTILITGVGLAPTFWIQDALGFTVDRVGALAPTQTNPPAVMPLVDGRLKLAVAPLPAAPPLPTRADLASYPVAIDAIVDGQFVFRDTLRPGERATVGPWSLLVEDLRYWASLQVVVERGGGWLAVGFALAVVGLVWRLVWCRREIAVTLTGDTVSIHGRSELYQHRFARELETVTEVLRTELEVSP